MRSLLAVVGSLWVVVLFSACGGGEDGAQSEGEAEAEAEGEEAEAEAEAEAESEAEAEAENEAENITVYLWCNAPSNAEYATADNACNTITISVPIPSLSPNTGVGCSHAVTTSYYEFEGYYNDGGGDPKGDIQYFRIANTTDFPPTPEEDGWVSYNIADAEYRSFALKDQQGWTSGVGVEYCAGQEETGGTFPGTFRVREVEENRLEFDFSVRVFSYNSPLPGRNYYPCWSYSGWINSGQRYLMTSARPGGNFCYMTNF